MKAKFVLFLAALVIAPFWAYGAHAPAGPAAEHLFNINKASYVKGLAISPDGREIWAALLMNKKRGVSVFNDADGAKIADIDLAGAGGVELIFSADGSKVYASQMETAQIFEIDAAGKKVLRKLKTGSTWTKVLALSPDGRKLYASNWVGNNVSEINLETGKLIRNIPTVKTPRGIYITKDGQFLYIAGFGKGELQKINLNTGEKKTIFKNGGALRHIVGDEEKGFLYISDMAKRAVWRLKLADDSVDKFIATDSHPNTIALSTDGKILFVSCRGRNNPKNYTLPGPEWGTVLLFDTADGRLLDAIIGGNQPTALATSPSAGSGLLAFSDFLDARVQVWKIPPYETLVQGNGDWTTVYKSKLRK